jgi:hypothetical protein
MKLSKDKLFSILKNPVLWKKNDVLANCPWCDHREFYISLNDNHPFNCVRKKKCGETGSLNKLLDKLGIRDEYNIKETISWSPTLNNELKNNERIEVDINLNEISLPIGFRRIYTDSYLNKRGFKESDYNDYFIGITNLDKKLINYIIFVVYNDFKQVATIGRFKGTKEECDILKKPRYKNSESDFAKILGGYDDLELGVTETVILCEGLFDSKNVSDLLDLKNNKSTKCCYSFKCHISDEQLYKLQLKGIKNVLLLYDSDVLQKVKETAVNLSKHFNVSVGLIECKNEQGQIKDPGELNKEELQAILNNTYSPLDFYTKKVQILEL